MKSKHTALDLCWYFIVIITGGSNVLSLSLGRNRIFFQTFQLGIEGERWIQFHFVVLYIQTAELGINRRPSPTRYEINECAWGERESSIVPSRGGPDKEQKVSSPLFFLNIPIFGCVGFLLSAATFQYESVQSSRKTQCLVSFGVHLQLLFFSFLKV